MRMHEDSFDNLYANTVKFFPWRTPLDCANFTRGGRSTHLLLWDGRNRDSGTEIQGQFSAYTGRTQIV